MRKNDMFSAKKPISQTSDSKQHLNKDDSYSYSLPKDMHRIHPNKDSNPLEFKKTHKSILNPKKNSQITFDIVRIEENADCIRLYGHGIVCIVKDFWMDTKFFPGMSITISTCLCCDHSKQHFNAKDSKETLQGVASEGLNLHKPLSDCDTLVTQGTGVWIKDFSCVENDDKRPSFSSDIHKDITSSRKPELGISNKSDLDRAAEIHPDHQTGIYYIHNQNKTKKYNLKNNLQIDSLHCLSVCDDPLRSKEALFTTKRVINDRSNQKMLNRDKFGTLSAFSPKNGQKDGLDVVENIHSPKIYDNDDLLSKKSQKTYFQNHKLDQKDAIDKNIDVYSDVKDDFQFFNIKYKNVETQKIELMKYATKSQDTKEISDSEIDSADLDSDMVTNDPIIFDQNNVVNEKLSCTKHCKISSPEIYTKSQSNSISTKEVQSKTSKVLTKSSDFLSSKISSNITMYDVHRRKHIINNDTYESKKRSLILSPSQISKNRSIDTPLFAEKKFKASKSKKAFLDGEFETVDKFNMKAINEKTKNFKSIHLPINTFIHSKIFRGNSRPENSQGYKNILKNPDPFFPDLRANNNRTQTLCKEINNRDVSAKSDIQVIQVNKKNNILIINGSIYSVTAICASFRCLLAPVIDQFVLNIDLEWKHHSLVIGVIIHAVIERCLENNNYNLKFIIENIQEEIKKNIALIYSCNTSEKKIKNECVSFVQSIMSLKNKRMNALKVEEKVISTFLGLKGNIDAIIAENGHSVPLEIKTGRNLDVAHRAQLLLYLIMMNEIEPSFLPYGILYYAQKNDHMKLNIKHEEVCGILSHKNRISSHEFCNKNNICAESNIFGSRGIISTFDESFLLTQNHIENGLKPLCSCDPSNICQLIYQLQSMEGDKGNFLRNQWEAIYQEEMATFNLPKFKCEIIHQKGTILGLNCYDILGFAINDYVEIFTAQSAHLTYGKIDQISFPYIQLIIPIHSTFGKIKTVFISESTSKLFFKTMRFAILKFGLSSDLIVNQKKSISSVKYDVNSSINLYNDILDTFCGDSSVLNDLKMNEHDRMKNKTSVPSELENQTKPKIIALEKYDPNDVKNQEKVDLLDLGSNKPVYFPSSHNDDVSLVNSINSQKTRNSFNLQGDMDGSITDAHNDSASLLDPINSQNQDMISSFLENNTFIKNSQLDNKALLQIPDIYMEEFLNLNDDQRHALYLSINCERFNIVHGFPGSGKSTLISLLIKILAYYHKKVLLICYTNLALDNVLRKTTVKYYRALKDGNASDTVEGLKQKFDQIELVAGTCFSFSDIVFIKQQFDFCIIDEASQIHFPLALIPVGISQKFILVGDHLQLRPISKVSEVLQYSLFHHLLESRNFCQLKKQYRMGDRIMDLSNQLFYKNKMVGIGAESEIIFLDSQRYDSYHDILKSLEISTKTTILCYFNKQVALIKSIVGDRCAVETVDRYQGSENDHIVLVFDPVIDCEIMSSNERLNVGLTRAKSRLTLIGDKDKMEKIHPLNDLIRLIYALDSIHVPIN